MRIRDMSWHQVEGYLKRDDRAVLPLGSTEQHAGLSLSVDSILAEKVALDAAEPLGIPVFPPVNYGLTPYFLAYPGTVSLRVETYVRLIREILDSLAGHGFRRILIVNGHGGNQPAHPTAIEWMADHPGVRVKFHNWWNAPETLGQGPGDRPGRLARLLDGELSLDPARGRRAAQGAKADDRLRPHAPPRPEGAARIPR